MNDRLESAIDLATDQFWESIAKSYPEINSGDMPPDAVFELENAMQKAIELWLNFNMGKGND